VGGGGGGDRGGDCGVCAICLDKIALQETALVKGCDHAYWFVASLSDSPSSSFQLHFLAGFPICLVEIALCLRALFNYNLIRSQVSNFIQILCIFGPWG
jgi:hypothetical protein